MLKSKLIIAILLLIIWVITSFIDGSYVEYYHEFAIVGILLLGYAFAKIEDRANKKFEMWIHSNYDDIVEGKAKYKGRSITRDTVLKQYGLCCSFLLVTNFTKSRYLIKNRRIDIFRNLLYTLTTLSMGWWGFPWGIIYTPIVIITNLTGGKEITVHNLMYDELMVTYKQGGN